MGALSSKDKLKLKLSAAKVERWNRERTKPAKNFTMTASGKLKPIVRGESLVLNLIDGKAAPKPAESVVPDKTEATNALSNGHAMRLPCGKLTMVRRGDTFVDYQDADYSESPRDPIRPKIVYRARPDSPFKRAGKAAASVVIVRK